MGSTEGDAMIRKQSPCTLQFMFNTSGEHISDISVICRSSEVAEGRPRGGGEQWLRTPRAGLAMEGAGQHLTDMDDLGKVTSLLWFSFFCEGRGNPMVAQPYKPPCCTGNLGALDMVWELELPLGSRTPG